MTRFRIVWGVLALLGTASVCRAAELGNPPAPPADGDVSAETSLVSSFTDGGADDVLTQVLGDGQRPLFQSDHCFDNFIGPITNPVLSKDARSLTEARFLFVQNKIDPDHPFGGGDFQAYGLQLRLALTERLTLIADKDGYAVISPKNGPQRNGTLDLAAGLKYAFIRDVDEQFLLTGGLMYEIQSGSSEVFQSHGDGIFTVFGSTAKEYCQHTHWLNTVGYNVPVDGDANSSSLYWSTHLDYEIDGWLYPLIEANWYHWVSSGDRGLPPALGEGDGLINLGTSGVTGNDMVTVAVGGKAKLTQNIEFGAAWELPVSPRHDLLNNRLTAELIFRY